MISAPIRMVTAGATPTAPLIEEIAASVWFAAPET